MKTEIKKPENKHKGLHDHYDSGFLNADRQWEAYTKQLKEGFVEELKEVRDFTSNLTSEAEVDKLIQKYRGKT